MMCSMTRIIVFVCSFVTAVYSCTRDNYILKCSNMTRESLLDQFKSLSFYPSEIEIQNVSIYGIYSDIMSSYYVRDLVTLKITNSNITFLEQDRSFGTLKNFDNLYINDINLVQLNITFLRLHNLFKILDLSNNNIQNFSINFNYNFLKLILNNNNFTSLTKSNFKINCQYLNTLEIQNSSIKYIEAGVLSGLPRLRNLDLSKNSLQNLETQFFVGMHQLQMINLQNSGIEEIKANAFFGLKQIQIINLKQNSINHLITNTFNGIQNIRKLDLSFSNINTIESGAFNGLYNLHSLNLNSNKMTNITKETFNILMNLEILDLSYNNILLKSQLFENIPNATTLILWHNSIKDLPCKLFNKNNVLKILDLSHNEIGKISLCAFESLNQLTNLNLHQNKLSYLRIGTFSGLHNLQYLNLSYNQITNLEGSVIDPLEKLINIDISANRIKNFDPVTIVEHLRNLQQIDFSGNIWNCLSLTAARKYLKSRHIQYKSKINTYEEENIGGVQCYTNEDKINNTLPLSHTTDNYDEKMDGNYSGQIEELKKLNHKYFQQMLNQNQNFTHQTNTRNEKYFQQIINALQNIPQAIKSHTGLNKLNSSEMKSEKFQDQDQIQTDIVNELRKGNDTSKMSFHIFLVTLIIFIFCVTSYYGVKFYKTIKSESNISRSDIELLSNISTGDSLENDF